MNKQLKQLIVNNITLSTQIELLILLFIDCGTQYMKHRFSQPANKPVHPPTPGMTTLNLPISQKNDMP
jgi:hypothetical protein